jgi:hypothetical protein
MKPLVFLAWIVLMLAAPGILTAQPVAVELDAQPRVVSSDVPTLVTITARVSASPALIATSINLVEYDIGGKAVGAAGRMFDDGTHGDVASNDQVFTQQLTITRSAPALIIFRASVALRGRLKRDLSDPISVAVPIQTTAAEIRDQLAVALGTGDVQAASQFLGSRLRANGVLTRLTAADRQQLVAALSTCTITDATSVLEVCEGSVIEDGGPRLLHFMFIRDALGVWRLSGW